MTAVDEALTAGGAAGPRWPSFRLSAPFLGWFGGRLGRWAVAILAPILLLSLWQAAYALGLVRPILLPPPSWVAGALWELTASGQLFNHVAVSALRVIQGFFLAAALALALGVAIGLSRTLDRMLDLTIQLIKPIPPIAWIPLAILWFGIGEEAKVAIIAVGGFFPILINTIDGIRQTDHRHVELARLLETPRWKFIRQVVLPGALPAIMSGLRIGLNVSWMCVVAAELVAASSGVGYLIMDARQLSQTDLVLAGMATMGVLGKLTDDALRIAEKRLVVWRAPFAGA